MWVTLQQSTVFLNKKINKTILKKNTKNEKTKQQEDNFGRKEAKQNGKKWKKNMRGKLKLNS